MDLEPITYTYFDSPLGTLLLVKRPAGLARIAFEKKKGDTELKPGWERRREPFRKTIEQLMAYFRGELRDFSIPIAPEGTPFQLKIWRVLREIPYGQTRTYREIAMRIGKPDAVRAVGAANGKNPLPIVVPCHRVIGSDGSLTGYGGGVDLKKFLLELEREHAAVPDSQLTIG